MEVTFCFDDENMRSFLAAKRCMEDELDEELCGDDCIGRLAEFFMDVKKGEKVVYDTDPEE